MEVKKQQLELMEKWAGFKLGKQYIKTRCHPAYLANMQSTSCEMPGQMKHKLESRLLGEISINSDMQITLQQKPFMAESEKELKSLLMKVKEESEKAGLKFRIQKMKNMASGPITS